MVGKTPRVRQRIDSGKNPGNFLHHATAASTRSSAGVTYACAHSCLSSRPLCVTSTAVVTIVLLAFRLAKADTLTPFGTTMTSTACRSCHACKPCAAAPQFTAQRSPEESRVSGDA